MNKPSQTLNADEIIKQAWEQFQLARHSKAFTDWYTASVEKLEQQKPGQENGS